MLHYPVDYPADAARIIVKHYRANDIASNDKVVAEAAWNLIGYGLKASFGPTNNTGNMPLPTESVITPATMLSDETLIEALEHHDALPAEAKLTTPLPLDNNMMVQWAFNLATKIMNNVI